MVDKPTFLLVNLSPSEPLTVFALTPSGIDKYLLGSKFEVVRPKKQHPLSITFTENPNCTLFYLLIM